MNKFNHPLMQSNFASSDFKNVSDFLKINNILTQSKKVSEYKLENKLLIFFKSKFDININWSR